MKTIVIIGNSSDKFAEEQKITAKSLITKIIQGNPGSTISSGRCPIGHYGNGAWIAEGGIDIWTEEIANKLGCKTLIFPPICNRCDMPYTIPPHGRCKFCDYSWNGRYGFKARNTDLANTGTEINVILTSKYPPEYDGKRFNKCYHHSNINKGMSNNIIPNHIKSGACWTANLALELNKNVTYWIIGANDFTQIQLKHR